MCWAILNQRNKVIGLFTCHIRHFIESNIDEIKVNLKSHTNNDDNLEDERVTDNAYIRRLTPMQAGQECLQ